MRRDTDAHARLQNDELAHQDDLVEDDTPFEKVNEAAPEQERVELVQATAEPAAVGQPDKGRRRSSVDVDVTEPSALNLPAEVRSPFPPFPLLVSRSSTG